MYQITNLINGKIYVGVHRTEDVNDGYMGSGFLILSAIKKYGRESFKKDILEMFSSIDEMFQRESEVVNTVFIQREDTYNLCIGGGPSSNGRYTGILTKQRGTGLHSKEANEKAKIASEAWRKANPEQIKKIQGIATQAALSVSARQKRKDTLQNIRHQQGEKNSQFGTMWVTDGKENKKIKKDEAIPSGWKKGRYIIIR